MNIGDKVEWVPSIEHHLEVKDGKYAWEHSVSGKVLTTEQVREFLKRNARRPETIKTLIPTKPQCTYPATVTAIDGDDVAGNRRASLDIVSPIGGVTLHYENIPVDASGKPGTCH